MKKFLLVIIFACAVNFSYAQMIPGDSGNTCVDQTMEDFTSCLSSYGVVYDLSYDSGTIYITAESNRDSGLVQSCIAHYERAISDCAEAPKVVNVRSNRGKNAR